MGLYGYGAVWLWGCVAMGQVMGLYGYGAVWLWGCMVMGRC